MTGTAPSASSCWSRDQGVAQSFCERRLALRARKTFDARRHQPADVERLAPGRGVRDEDRLLIMAYRFEVELVEVEPFAPLVVVDLQDFSTGEPRAQCRRDVVVGG